VRTRTNASSLVCLIRIGKVVDSRIFTESVVGKHASVVVGAKRLNRRVGGIKSNSGSVPERCAISVIGTALAKRAVNVAHLNLVGLLDPNGVWAAGIYNPIVNRARTRRIARLVRTINVPPVRSVGADLDKEFSSLFDIETILVAFEEEGDVKGSIPSSDFDNRTGCHSWRNAFISWSFDIIFPIEI
jgi:hypothetical protein